MAPTPPQSPPSPNDRVKTNPSKQAEVPTEPTPTSTPPPAKRPAAPLKVLHDLVQALQNQVQGPSVPPTCTVSKATLATPVLENEKSNIPTPAHNYASLPQLPPKRVSASPNHRRGAQTPGKPTWAEAAVLPPALPTVDELLKPPHGPTWAEVAARPPGMLEPAQSSPEGKRGSLARLKALIKSFPKRKPSV